MTLRGMAGMAWASVTLEARRSFRWRGILIPVAVLLLCDGLLLLLGPVDPPADEVSSTAIFCTTTVIVVLQLAVPLLALLHGSSLVRDELEEGTLSYLLVRPVPRPVLYLGKWGAHALVLGALAALSVLLGGLLFGMRSPEPLAVRPVLVLAATAFLVVPVHLAVYSFVGLVFRRALVAGFILAFVSELLAHVPAVVRKVTITHYAVSGLLLDPSTAGAFGTLQEGGLPVTRMPSSGLVALAGLAIIGGGFLALGGLVFTMREWIGGKRAEDAEE